MSIYTKAFWKDATERAIATGAQFVIGGTVLSEAGPVNAFEIDWALAGGFALSGVVLAYLTALAAGAAKRRPR